MDNYLTYDEIKDRSGTYHPRGYSSTEIIVDKNKKVWYFNRQVLRLEKADHSWKNARFNPLKLEDRGLIEENVRLKEVVAKLLESKHKERQVMILVNNALEQVELAKETFVGPAMSQEGWMGFCNSHFEGIKKILDKGAVVWQENKQTGEKKTI